MLLGSTITGLPDVRAASMDRGFLSRASGSGRFALGGTECIASVFGPGAATKQGGAIAEECTIVVRFRNHKGQRLPSEDDAGRLLRDLFSGCISSRVYPGSTIWITAQMITVDGSAISVAATACALALVDAGVELKAFPATSSVAVLPSGSILIDPTSKEESAARATVRVTTHATHEGELNALASVMTQGPLDPEELDAATSAAAAAALSVRTFARDACIAAVIADPTLRSFDERAVKKMVRGMAKEHSIGDDAPRKK